MPSPDTLSKRQAVRRSVVVGRGLRARCRRSNVPRGRSDPGSLRIRWRRVREAPGSDRIVVGGIGTAVRGRWRGVLGGSRVEPGALHVRAALVLRRDRSLGGHERLGNGLVVSDNGGVNGRQGLTRRLLGPDVGLCTPVVPVSAPRGKSVLLIIDALVDLPVKGKEPLELHLVQFSHGDVAHFGPRLVLEGIIIQEFAAQQQTHRQHTVNLATAGLEDPLSGQDAHAARHVEQAQQNSRTGEAGRGQDLEDVFPELRGHGSSWGDASREVNI